MKAYHGLGIGLAALVLAATGCNRGVGTNEKPGPRKVVVKVNSQKLLWRDMEKRAEGFLQDEVKTKSLVIPEGKRGEALDYFRRRAVKVFVLKTLFLADAKRLGIQVTDADRKQGLEKLEQVLKNRNLTANEFFAQAPMGEKYMRAEFEDGLIIDKLLEQEVKAKIKVEDKDMDQVATEISKVRMESRKKIDAIHKELLAGGDFTALARRSSECPSAKDGGDLGEFERGKSRLGKEIDAAAFSQKVGAVGDVIETRQGYHIVKVTARAKAKAATATTPAVPETARASHILIRTPSMSGREITNEVLRRKYAKGVEDYYRSLREKAQVECMFPDLIL
jgi:parvulin-like peptidyl-prolyl isomerase